MGVPPPIIDCSLARNGCVATSSEGFIIPLIDGRPDKNGPRNLASYRSLPSDFYLLLFPTLLPSLCFAVAFIARPGVCSASVSARWRFGLVCICGWWPSGRGEPAFGLLHCCLAPPSNPANKPQSHTVISTTKPCLLTCYSPGGGTTAFMICAHGTVELIYKTLPPSHKSTPCAYS